MKRIFKDELIKDTAVVFSASTIVNIFNLLFQLVMVRGLTAVDYGVLNSLLSMLVILSIPIGTVQTAVVKFVSEFAAHKQWDKVKKLLLGLSRKTFLVSIIMFTVIIIARGNIADFLRIPNQALIVLLAFSVFLSAIIPLVLAALQGLQRFGYLGLSSIAGGAFKLISGFVVIKFGFGVFGAMNAIIISTIIGFLLAFLPFIYFITKVKQDNSKEDVNFTSVYKYFYPVSVVLFCIMVLTNIDIILVKHFFSAHDAGLYSVAQMVGKIIFFLPGAITIVMFPKSSASYAKEKDTISIFKRSLVILTLVCSAAGLVCILFPSFVIEFLSGKSHPDLDLLVRLFAVTMIPFAMINLILHYKLSVHKLRFIPWLAFFTLLQVVLISLFHSSLVNVLFIMLANSIILLIILLILLKK